MQNELSAIFVNFFLQKIFLSYWSFTYFDFHFCGFKSELCFGGFCYCCVLFFVLVRLYVLKRGEKKKNIKMDGKGGGKDLGGTGEGQNIKYIVNK